MQPVITKEFVTVIAVPVTMDGTTNQIVQVMYNHYYIFDQIKIVHYCQFAHYLIVEDL